MSSPRWWKSTRRGHLTTPQHLAVTLVLMESTMAARRRVWPSLHQVEWPREGSLTPPPPLTLPEKRVAHWKKLCELQKEELMNLMSVNAVMMLPLRHHRPRCVSEVIFHTPYAHSHHSCESLSFKSYTHPIWFGLVAGRYDRNVLGIWWDLWLP